MENEKKKSESMLATTKFISFTSASMLSPLSRRFIGIVLAEFYYPHPPHNSRICPTHLLCQHLTSSADHEHPRMHFLSRGTHLNLVVAVRIFLSSKKKQIYFIFQYTKNAVKNE